MTDPTHDREAELDELASAFLDGQTSHEEARRVAGDPALMARVDRLRGARDAVRVPDLPADPVRRELAIAAALLAAGHEPVTAPAPVPVADELAAARARRSSRRHWVPLVGVAAAIALAALLVPQLGDDSGRDDTLASKSETFDQRIGDPSDPADGGRGADSSASAERGPTLGIPADPDAGPTGGAAGSGSAESRDGELRIATTTTAPPDEAPDVPPTPGSETTLATSAGHLVDLGSFDAGDEEEVRAAAQEAAENPKATSSPGSGVDRTEVDRCVGPMEEHAVAEDEDARVLYAAVAEVGDETVVGIAVELDGDRYFRSQFLPDCEEWFTAAL